MIRVLWAWAPAAAVALLIFCLSSLPPSKLPLPFPSFDKIAHALIFGVLALCVARAFWTTRHPQRAQLLRLTILCVSFYGVVDEWHQHFVPGRSQDPMDWVADTVGSVGGALGFLALLRWHQRRV